MDNEQEKDKAGDIEMFGGFVDTLPQPEPDQLVKTGEEQDFREGIIATNSWDKL